MTNNEINKLAAEVMYILGWHSPDFDSIGVASSSSCTICGEDGYGLNEHSDFCKDLNAAQKLAIYCCKDKYKRWKLGAMIHELVVSLGMCPTSSVDELGCSFLLSPKVVTLAILAALDKITLEQAKECL